MYLKRVRIFTKNNHITRFNPGTLNTIIYITNHLKYITLIMKTNINIKKCKNYESSKIYNTNYEKQTSIYKNVCFEFGLSGSR